MTTAVEDFFMLDWAYSSFLKSAISLIKLKLAYIGF
jgi:hypothetical protein